MPTSAAKAPLPGSKEAAAAGLAVTVSEPPAQPGDGRMPQKKQDYPAPKMGDFVRYIAPDGSDRVALVVYVWEWGGNFVTEVDPLAVNLYVWAIDNGDGQLWRESDVTRLPGDCTGYAHQVPARTGFFAERGHTWRWPE